MVAEEAPTVTSVSNVKGSKADAKAKAKAISARNKGKKES